jgi:ribosomal protein L11 methyltransferase
MNWTSRPASLLTPVRLAPMVTLYAAGQTPPDVGPGAVTLATTPSAAFGDGSHPTTRLCARAVDLICRQQAPQAVLDVGTGTGVLARLARAHGATFVVGTDTEPVALEAAQANAALDAQTGELRFENRPPDAWGPRFDLVVANILEGVLLALAPSLAAALTPRGRLLLSGFTPAQAPSLRAAMSAHGLEIEVQATLDGWSLLQFRRKAS